MQHTSEGGGSRSICELRELHLDDTAHQLLRKVVASAFVLAEGEGRHLLQNIPTPQIKTLHEWLAAALDLGEAYRTARRCRHSRSFHMHKRIVQDEAQR